MIKTLLNKLFIIRQYELIHTCSTVYLKSTALRFESLLFKSIFGACNYLVILDT